MLENLCVNNFRSYEKSEIDLHSGLNVFLGEVGAGKTSILEALSFALFGKISTNMTQTELIKRGSKQARVILVFRVDSEKYKVERNIFVKKTQRARLWLYKNNNWRLAVEGSTAVSKSIEEILGVDSSTFLAAIYASQGEIKKMLQTQPGKRREQFDKLLGIDVYEKLWDTMGQSKSLVLKELLEVQKQASGFEILTDQQKNITREIKEKNYELDLLRTSLAKIKKELISKEKQLNYLEELKINIDSTLTKKEENQKSIKKVKERIESLKDQILKTKKAEEIYKNNQKYLEKEDEIRNERERIDKAIQKKCTSQRLLDSEKNFLDQKNQKRMELEKQLETLPDFQEELKKLENLKAKYSDFKKQKKDKQTKLDHANEEYFKILQKNENETEKISRINELGECPTCLQEVPEKHKDHVRENTIQNQLKLIQQIEKWEKIKSKIQDDIVLLNQQIEIAEEASKKFERVFVEVEVLEKSKNELEKIKEDTASIQNRIYSLNWELSGIVETDELLKKIEIEFKEVVEKAKTAREAELKLASRQDLENLITYEEENLAILNEEYNNSQNRYQEILKEYNITNHVALKDIVEALKDKEARASEGINRLITYLQKDEVKLEEVQKSIIEKSEAKKKTKILETERRVLEIVRNGLRDILQPAVRKNNVMMVSEEFRSFYQALSNDNIDYAAIDEDGNIEVIRNGEPSPINTLSGGETTCAALALRLSICSSLTKNQLLLLDEPTIHLDEVYRAKLRDFLRTHEFEQLIVVTHDNTFDSLPAQIFNVEKKNGDSTVTSLRVGG
jgi:exonuclease SbcC